MKALNALFILFGLTLLTFTLNAQDYKKPDPVKNSTTEMLIGTWVADPYEMMGEKRTETATHYMKLGQYMFIDIVGGNDKNPAVYNATVIIKINPDGTLTGWSFDDWGFTHTYTGTASGNKISVSGTGDMGTETRDIEINGNTMTHKVTFNMKGADGNPMTMNMNITYHKK